MAVQPGRLPPPTYPLPTPISSPPCEALVEDGADKILKILQNERSASLTAERDRTRLLEQRHNTHRQHHEQLRATWAAEKRDLTNRVLQLEQQLGAACRSTLNAPIPKSEPADSALAFDPRVRDLELQVSSLTTRCKQLEAEMKNLVIQCATALGNLGIFSSSPGVYTFGGNWPQLFDELGLDSTKPWAASDLNECISIILDRLRQRRISALTPNQVTALTSTHPPMYYATKTSENPPVYPSYPSHPPLYPNNHVHPNSAPQHYPNQNPTSDSR
ncbi:hypothetical protein FA15DRAFT_663416 [Coprinopsis marcescibilis]|uniref:Uncharacterized protein n=1 Tax=Coprinopsis marcescibilis TaxID=230819 RepID=A0A5C3LCB1_COPMA|nr:hypothetical protein FA15DRAFT_663416 [Coprinopsis marcescibilis]